MVWHILLGLDTQCFSGSMDGERREQDMHTDFEKMEAYIAITLKPKVQNRMKVRACDNCAISMFLLLILLFSCLAHVGEPFCFHAQAMICGYISCRAKDLTFHFPELASVETTSFCSISSAHGPHDSVPSLICDNMNRYAWNYAAPHITLVPRISPSLSRN